MTLEEMKTELENNGYRVIKIGGQAKWAQDVWSKLWRHASNKLFEKQSMFDHGTIGSNNRMEYFRNYVRQNVKKKYGYGALGNIPPEMIPEIAEYMVKIGIERIDQLAIGEF
jgi:hypothetical protein